MSGRLRFLIFLLFALVFLISAPLLVLYTAGYRLDLSNASIVHTAVFSTTTNPKGATVYIDNTPSSDKTPSVIETVLPGKRTVRIEKDGYLPWRQTLDFKSRETTFALDVVLFLDATQSSVQELDVFASIYTSQHLIYLTQESSWIEAWRSTGTPTSTQLMARLTYDPDASYQLLTSTKEDYLIIAATKDTEQELVLIDIEASQTLPIDLGKTENVWWDTQDDHILYTTYEGQTTRVDLVGDHQTLLETSLQSATTFGDNLLIVSTGEDRSTLSFLHEKTVSLVSYLPLGTYSFEQAPGGTITLYDAARSQLQIIDPENREQPILFSEDVTLWQWSHDGGRLLYSSGYDIRIYDRWAHKTRTVARISESIDQLSWYPLGNYILFQSNGQTKAIALGDPQPEHTILVQDITGAIWPTSDGDNLYLLDELGTLWRRPLQK